MLRRGVIPPPAEAHHRAEGAPIPEGARSGGGDLRPEKTAPAKEVPVEEPQEETSSTQQQEPEEPADPWIWIVLAAAGVMLGRFVRGQERA